MNLNGIKIRLAKDSNLLKDAMYTLKEEEQIYKDLLQDVYDNPRWYLDNLRFLPEFRLSWGNYRSNNSIISRKQDKKPKHL